MPYVSGLLAAFRSRYQSRIELSPRFGIADPLSAREGAILNLIAQGLSNKEIARDLAIAPETVKSHVKHIFIKLGAEKRAQAVARAQSLGLVTHRSNGYFQLLRGLRIRDPAVSDQPNSLKFELPRKPSSLHDLPPVP